MATVTFAKLHLANSEDVITAAINSLHKRSESLQLDLHRTLVAICIRWGQTGDVRPAVKHINHILTKGKLGGVRTNAIRAWVETYMGFTFLEEGDDKGTFKAGKMKGSALNIKELTNNRWWEFKPEPGYKPMDFDKMFLSLMSKAEKRSTEATDADNVDPGMLAALKAARQNYIESQVGH